MYNQGNVRGGKCAAVPARALPFVIVDTEKVLWEADGPEESDFQGRSLPRVERCSPLGAPQRTDGRAGEEPEEHKRQYSLSYQ